MPKQPAASKAGVKPDDPTVDERGEHDDAPEGDQLASTRRSSTSDGSGHSVGDFVTHTYLDPFVGAGGAEVTQVGVVVGIVDYSDDPAYSSPDGSARPDGYRVAWLPTASDPLGADVLDPLATDSTRSR